ncbi:tRNA (adenosine(37)-N6)-threonylcarbamoyltransferase complex ATPase subunit type 1 TsaE [Candidatus Saccharibacteria bacterium]|nr:tRNA (adenosine(37)-N6)-threonylcarbamoyltransferase complex ATPase subunit type 1 TsaE [Candidatus Saccharibacteria bacterium]
MIVKSEQEMLDLGTQFANNIVSNPNSPLVIELVGDVGAGKTTFVRGLAKGLSIKEPVTSPSFTISKSYALRNGGRLIHYDFYRLSDPGIMTEDLQENLTNPQNIILIEWGESVTDLLPKNHLTITINYTKTGNREVII